MTLYTRAAIAAIIFALGLAAGIKYESGEVAKLKLSHAEASLQDTREARATESKRSLNVHEAQNAAAKRTQVAQADAAATRSELDRLRDAIRVYNGVSGESASACHQRADTLGFVFAQCAGRLVEVARDADAQADAVKLLQDAWPQ